MSPQLNQNSPSSSMVTAAQSREIAVSAASGGAMSINDARFPRLSRLAIDLRTVHAAAGITAIGLTPLRKALNPGASLVAAPMLPGFLSGPKNMVKGPITVGKLACKLLRLPFVS